MKRTRILASLLVLFLLCNMPILAKSSGDKSTTILEYFSLSELENHKNVKEYLEKNNITEKNMDEFLNKNFKDAINKKLASEPSSIATNRPTVKDLKIIAEKYGLSTPKLVDRGNVYVIAENKEVNGVTLTGNVWYVYYTTTDTSFNVSVANIGKDPLDVIDGKITLYSLFGRNWDYKDTRSFNKIQVPNGSVYTWNIRKANVEEKFIYEIAVIEDGVLLKYSNESNPNKQHKRWWFNGGGYHELSSLGGELHHLVSKEALERAGFNSSKGAVIRMTVFDHVKTPNYGNYNSSVDFRDEEIAYLLSKNYSGLLKFEVNALKKIADPEDEFDSLEQKYAEALSECLWYAEMYFGI